LAPHAAAADGPTVKTWLWAAGVIAAALAIDVAGFLLAVEYFDGDYDFGFDERRDVA